MSFTHIKWEAGFHGFEGENSNPYIRVFIMIFILINTFSSVLIVSVGGIGLLNYNDLFKDIKAGEVIKTFVLSLLKFHSYSCLKVNKIKAFRVRYSKELFKKIF